MQEIFYKILILGDSKVGKKQFFGCFDDKNIIQTSQRKVNFLERNDDFDDKIVHSQIFKKTHNLNIPIMNIVSCDGSGVFLLYDVSNKKSFLSLPTYITQIRKDLEQIRKYKNQAQNLVFVLIGINRFDEKSREVSIEEGQEFALKEQFLFFETNGTDPSSIANVFSIFLHELFSHYKSSQNSNENNNQNQNENLNDNLLENNQQFSRIEKVENPDYKFRVLLSGPVSGKTSLMNRYVDQNFSDLQSKTIGIDFKVVYLENNMKNTTVKLDIWDTESYRHHYHADRSHFKNVHGCVVMYDITWNHSFEYVQDLLHDFYSDFCGKVSFILVGCKCDLNEKRVISKEQGEELAKQYNIPFIEISNKENINVELLFEQICSKMIDEANEHQSNEPVEVNQNANSQTEERSSKKGIFGFFRSKK